MERIYKVNENGRIEKAVEVVEKETKQKNYVIAVEVSEGIRDLAKENKINESRMIEEMYYTFMELLEKGKAEKKTTKKAGRTANAQANTEVKEGK